jgi:SAM-dependent methyltransferase
MNRVPGPVALDRIDYEPAGSREKPETSERLYPSRFNSRYYILTLLRRTMRAVTKQYVWQGRGQVVVDYGCGTSPYRPLFEKYVSSYIGVDLPGQTAANAFVGTSGTTNLADSSADIVLSTQVLEHVDRPSTYLQECHRILKQSGLLVLSTHGYWMYHPDPCDFWRWTSSGLQKAIRECDFEIIEFLGLMGFASTSVQLFQDACMPKVPGFARPLFSWFMQTVAMLLDKLHSPSARAREACLFVVVARKTEG